MIGVRSTASRESTDQSGGPTLLERTLAYARERDYRGWDYGDGMSSELLQRLPVDNKWLNLAVQESIKRAPVNLRPLLRVEQRRNFKGIALFVMANLNAAELLDEDAYRNEAAELVEWLLDHQSDWYPEFCGCHRHDLQGLDGKEEAGTPGVVGTSYGVQALLRAAEEIDEGYADIALTAADFVFDRLNYQEFDTGARILYKPTDTGNHYTLNANALGARILLDLYAEHGENRLLDGATGILDYVVSRQSEEGGWMYRDPPSASHLSMDNHHNGFIIETLLRYEEVVGSGRYRRVIKDSLSFYRDTLFDPDGAPNWDESSSFPRDIHAAGQGVLVFTNAGEFDRARGILGWTLDNLYGRGGRFYYRKHRFYTKRVTLMRWCQAWMAYAVSEYLVAGGSEPLRGSGN